MFERLADLASEHAALERELADPAVHADAERARALGRRYGELSAVVHTYQDWQRAVTDEQDARELAGEDASFGPLAQEAGEHRAGLEQQLQELLVPRDPHDDKDVLLEVKAGEGGEESALFAGDLLRMYLRYAERQGWKTEVLAETTTGLGGYKDVTVAVKSRGRGPGTERASRLHGRLGRRSADRVPRLGGLAGTAGDGSGQRRAVELVHVS